MGLMLYTSRRSASFRSYNIELVMTNTHTQINKIDVGTIGRFKEVTLEEKQDSTKRGFYIHSIQGVIIMVEYTPPAIYVP